jgi:hypothetical protein
MEVSGTPRKTGKGKGKENLDDLKRDMEMVRLRKLFIFNVLTNELSLNFFFKYVTKRFNII